MSRTNEPPTVLEDLSRDELLVLARQNEKALNDERVRADTAEKRAVLADTTNRSHRGRPRKRTRPTRSLLSDDENIPDDDQVEDDSPEEKIGLVVLVTAESVLETKLSQSYEEKNRFTNQSQKKQGELRAVRELLPEELRGELRKEWAIFEQWDGSVQTRRRDCATIEPVFNIHLKALDAERFKDVADVLEDAKRAGLADLIGGKKNAAGKITYPPWPLLSCIAMGRYPTTPRRSCTINLLCMLLPPSSLGNRRPVHSLLGRGRVRAVDITRTTPGMVRNTSVLTLWTLSADTSLKKCGQQTAVNWHLIGEQIHEWLLNGLRNRHEPVLRLFREWDDELFPDTEASLGAALGTGSANTEDLHEALEALSHTQVVEMDTGSGDEDDVEGTTGVVEWTGKVPGMACGREPRNESAEELADAVSGEGVGCRPWIVWASAQFVDSGTPGSQIGTWGWWYELELVEAIPT
ncbi:hypothetical protein B0H14DRAFT_3141519 [Mycena olivaceomarginata]|nr:hypothetical protein B0H14DRAFT_3141519 [Mycena olivaceomarginata]